MEASPTGNLHGVWAKWERALEQLEALSKDVLALGKDPHAYTITSHENADEGKYIYRFQPAWPSQRIRRWGAIIGEIVHDLRSGLDQLVTQFVLLNDGTPSEDHFFPIWTKEPENGFAERACGQWTDRRKRLRHGPLFGVSDDALAFIEGCQPYKGADWARLRQLHDLWNTDKHRTLIPTMLMFNAATLKLRNAVQTARVDYFEGDTYVVEFTVLAGTPPPDPQVDVEPHAPTDIAFSDGSREGFAVIEELRQIGRVVLIGVVIPASEMFPEGAGIPPP